MRKLIRIQQDYKRDERRQTRRSGSGTRATCDGKVMLVICCALWSIQYSMAMLPASTHTRTVSINQRRSNGEGTIKLDFAPSSTSSQPTSFNPAAFSPLFQRIQQGASLRAKTRHHSPLVRPKKSRESFTARNMVLTTPESIIEQASTQNLLDDLIDESVRTSARRPIMMQFDPSRGYIWRLWRGTVFSETWRSCIRNMAIACVILVIAQAIPQMKTFLNGFGILWGQLLSVTTFTLTFFLNQSYALWRKCYELSRRLQGRLNDLGLLLASHASRKTTNNPTESSTYTPASRQLLELMARYIRLFNLLTYASFTRSHRPILTPRGMRRMVERGLLTPQERQVLVDAEVPATQRHNAVIMWIMRLYIEGRAAGHLQGGSGYEQQFLEKCHVIRSQYGAIGDELQGRMPLAYVHIVQVLVDVILWLYPVMAFSSNMSPILGILGTGLLTMTYQGLFDLAKQFLDPYDNENYGKGEDPLCVDTLVAETNSGSVRWLSGFNEMPFNSQRIVNGELFEYQLPIRGYSVEDLESMEEEKRQKEREAQERKERDEAHDKIEILDSPAEAVVDDLEDRTLHKVTALENGTPVITDVDNVQLTTSPEEILVDSSIQQQNATFHTNVIESFHVNGDVSIALEGGDNTRIVGSIDNAEDIVADGSANLRRDEIGEYDEQILLSQELIDDHKLEHDDATRLENEVQPPLTVDDSDALNLIESPLTLEDYYVRVEALKEAAMEEWKETEAILNAAPGADIPTNAKADVGPIKNPSGKEAIRVQEQAILAEMEDSLDALGKEAARVQEQLVKKAMLAKMEDSLDALEMDFVNDTEKHEVEPAAVIDSNGSEDDNITPFEGEFMIEDGIDNRKI